MKINFDDSCPKNCPNRQSLEKFASECTAIETGAESETDLVVQRPGRVACRGGLFPTVQTEPGKEETEALVCLAEDPSLPVIGLTVKFGTWERLEVRIPADIVNPPEVELVGTLQMDGGRHIVQ